MSAEQILIVLAGSAGFIATIVGLEQSWVANPLYAPFRTSYKLHHDHLSGPLWFHTRVNRCLNKVLLMRRLTPPAQVDRRALNLRRCQNFTFIISTVAFSLALIAQFV